MYLGFCLKEKRSIRKIISFNQKKYMKKYKNGIMVADVLAMGAGVTALGAGVYYYFGPKSKKHQKEVQAWIVGMKSEMEKTIKKTEKLTRPIYQKAVDVIAETYSKKYQEHKPEIVAFAKKLKSEWKNIEQASSPVKKVK